MVEWNGDFNSWSEFDWNAKGINIGYNYKINTDTTLKLLYKDMKDIDPWGDNPQANEYDEFSAAVTYKF